MFLHSIVGPMFRPDPAGEVSLFETDLVRELSPRQWFSSDLSSVSVKEAYSRLRMFALTWCDTEN